MRQVRMYPVAPQARRTEIDMAEVEREWKPIVEVACLTRELAIVQKEGDGRDLLLIELPMTQTPVMLRAKVLRHVNSQEVCRDSLGDLLIALLNMYEADLAAAQSTAPRTAAFQVQVTK